MSDPKTGIERATFWWPVGRFNDSATEIQKVGSGASSSLATSMVRGLECLTGHQKVAGSIPVLGLEIGFSEVWGDRRPTVRNAYLRTHPSKTVSLGEYFSLSKSNMQFRF